MTTKTQQQILSELNKMVADLEAWLNAMGVSRSRAEALMNDAFRENGVLAQLILDRSSEVLPKASGVKIHPHDVIGAADRINSQEFVDELLAQPEPSAEELRNFFAQMKDILPKLRHQFVQAGRLGPRFRRGGPKPKLTEAQMKQIPSEIRALRGPNSRLTVIYRKLGSKYGVKPAAIKYLWLQSSESRGDSEQTD